MLLWLMNLDFAGGTVVTPPPPSPPSGGMGKEISNYDEINEMELKKKRDRQNNLAIAMCKAYTECQL